MDVKLSWLSTGTVNSIGSGANPVDDYPNIFSNNPSLVTPYPYRPTFNIPDKGFRFLYTNPFGEGIKSHSFVTWAHFKEESSHSSHWLLKTNTY